MTALLPPINRARFALIVGGATLCATGVGAALAARAEGATDAATMAVAVMILASAAPSVFAVLPGLIKDEIWGLSVLGISAARTLLAMGAMLVLIEIAGMPNAPVVHGLLAGAMILTLAEAAAAVWQLQRREAARTPTTDPDAPAGVASSARRSL